MSDEPRDQDALVRDVLATWARELQFANVRLVRSLCELLAVSDFPLGWSPEGLVPGSPAETLALALRSQSKEPAHLGSAQAHMEAVARRQALQGHLATVAESPESLSAALSLVEAVTALAAEYSNPSRRLPQGFEAARAARVRSAVVPSSSEKIALAEAVVRRHGDKYRGAAATVAEPENNAALATLRWMLAFDLIMDISGRVDARFSGAGSFSKLIGETAALLERYAHGRRGRLGAESMTVELNRLAGYPFGHGFSRDSIKSAKRDKKGKRSKAARAERWVGELRPRTTEITARTARTSKR